MCGYALGERDLRIGYVRRTQSRSLAKTEAAAGACLVLSFATASNL